MNTFFVRLFFVAGLIVSLTQYIAAKPPPWAKPTWPEPPFTPAQNAYARCLVTEHFQLVHDLRKIDPAVLARFHTVVPRHEIANRGQPFSETDSVDINDLPRRFTVAGHTSDLWFVLYEVGGSRAYHHSILLFRKHDNHWRHVAAAIGSVDTNNFASLVKALKKGLFHEVFDDLNL